MEVNEHLLARPSPALRQYVAHYSGYRQRGVAPGRHRGLPSPYLTLILTLDEPLVVAAHPDRRQAPGRYDALVGGLHVTPALMEKFLQRAVEIMDVSVDSLRVYFLRGPRDEVLQVYGRDGWIDFEAPLIV